MSKLCRIPGRSVGLSIRQYHRAPANTSISWYISHDTFKGAEAVWRKRTAKVRRVPHKSHHHCSLVRHLFLSVGERPRHKFYRLCRPYWNQDKHFYLPISLGVPEGHGDTLTPPLGGTPLVSTEIYLADPCSRPGAPKGVPSWLDWPRRRLSFFIQCSNSRQERTRRRKVL